MTRGRIFTDVSQNMKTILPPQGLVSFTTIGKILSRYFWAPTVIAVLAGPITLHAATAIYQEGATTPFLGGAYTGAEDNTLYNNAGGYFNSATDNRGTVPGIEVGNAGGVPAAGASTEANRRSLLRFNVSSLNGQFTSINSVTLRLTTLAGVQGSGLINLFRLTDANANWVEGNGSGGATYEPNDAGGSTWAFKIQGAYPNEFTGTSWAGGGTVGQAHGAAGVAGTDYHSTAVSSFSYNITNAATGSTVDFVFSDLSFFGTWITGTNAGMILRQFSETGTNIVPFHSGESATLSARPQLIVDYTPVPESGTAALLGSGLLLLARRRRSR